MSPLITQKQGLRIKMLVAALSLVLAAGHICAQERNYDIQQQSLSQALRNYARASGVQIIFTEDLVRGRTAPPLQGEFTAEEALNRLLGGSGLRAERTPAGAVMIAKIGDDVQAPDSDGQDQASAANDSGPDTYEFDIPPQDLAGALRAFSRTTGQEVVFDRAVVRGKTSAPLRGTYTADEGIEILLTGTGLEVRRDPQGRLRVEEAVRVSDVPTEPEPVTEIERIAVTGTNIRGIAPDSSPVRIFTSEDIEISGAANAQEFIQKLPQNFGGGSNEAFIELPNDRNAGANATFGSSINMRGLGSGATLVLLNGNRLAPTSQIGDFVDISMIPASAIERVEILTDGASSIYGGDAVAGVTNFVLRDDFDGIEAALRYGTVTEGDLDEYRASIMGGKNWSSGNAILVYEFYNRDNLSAGDRDFAADALLPNDLLPKQERYSVLASVSQRVSDDVKLNSEVLYSQRESTREDTNIITADAGHNSANSEHWNVGTTLDWNLSRDWFIAVSGNYSKVRNETFGERIAGPSVGSQTVRDAGSELWSLNTVASGSILEIPGGTVKLAVGGQYREETFASSDRRLDLDLRTDRAADRTIYALFGEAFVPIVGPENTIPGIERFEINISGRFDDYSDFGSTFNPKVGVLWSPFDQLTLRGSYSTSFNPPPLGRVGAIDAFATAVPTLFINSLLGLTPGDPSIADTVLISVSGTDKNLGPENSQAYTVGLDFNQQWGRHEFTASTTWFDIKFEDRLGGTPCPLCTNNIAFDAPNIAFNSPELFPDGTFIFFPSSGQILDVLNSLDQPIFAVAGADPLDAGIISFLNVIRNLSRTDVRGFDFDVAYSFGSGVGQLSIGLDGTFLTRFQQQAAITSPVVDRLNILFNPVDLKLRGRAGYTYDGFAANVFLNFIDSYKSDSTSAATKIDSWTTIDLSLSYDTENISDRLMLDDTELRLFIQNIFNEAPPFTLGSPGGRIFGFDATNASPLGRFVAIELRKRF